MEMMTKVTIVSMVSGIITRGEVSRNDVLQGLYLKKKRKSKKKKGKKRVLGYND